jgi:hypothetical protein
VTEPAAGTFTQLKSGGCPGRAAGSGTCSCKGKEFFNCHLPIWLKGIAKLAHRLKFGHHATGYAAAVTPGQPRKDTDPEKIELGELGYARAATDSYRIFTRLIDEGRLVQRVRT